jgi:hypothetical protein
MPTPKKPRNPIARAKIVMDMLIAETPNDKAPVLVTEPGQEGRLAKAAHARAATQSPERRREVARKAAAAR